MALIGTTHSLSPKQAVTSCKSQGLPILWVILAVTFFGLMASTSHAQTNEIRRPVDMMIVIDNSCSMFPSDRIIPGCEVWGNDPEFLRITGANLFIARLGFAEINEADYQAGVVSFGDGAHLISPLQSLAGARDALARTIANPEPELATNIVSALKTAYTELHESPNRRATNLPAIVLITDGIPYPRAGQSNADIEQLVSENPDIPLFIMLLQNPDKPSSDYEQYIQFWQQMQSRYTNIFSYPISEAKQIEETYNTLVAQLQNTIPAKGIAVTSDVPLQVFVSRYVQKIVVTIIHEANQAKGKVTIMDSTGAPVLDNESGVSRFRGAENPVEVVSIGSPRLRDDLKESIWTITSDVPVVVFLDRQGAYRLNFLNPAVSLTDITNLYMATERQTPSHELAIRFNLLNTNGNVVTEPQTIRGQVITPDGQITPLAIPADLQPDNNGVYEIRFNFVTAYPAIFNKLARFTFIISAGLADEQATEPVPITRAQLMVDAGRGPYIENISTQPVVCSSDQSTEISIIVGDYETALADSIQFRIFAQSEEVTLMSDAPGTFKGDLTNLCATLITSLSCSTQQEAKFHMRLTAQMTDGSPLPPLVRDLPIQVIAPMCTPTPLPTPTPTSTPTPTPTPTLTPIPDNDGDGFNDLIDACPSASGLSQFDGCPSPMWLLVLSGLLIVVGTGFVIFWVIPWLKVRIWPPPRAYILIYQEGERYTTPKAIYNIGMTRRTNQVTIGGDPKKDHIYAKGLNPREFVVLQQGKKVVLADGKTENTKATFSETALMTVQTTNPKVTLKISLDQSRLR